MKIHGKTIVVLLRTPHVTRNSRVAEVTTFIKPFALKVDSLKGAAESFNTIVSSWPAVPEARKVVCAFPKRSTVTASVCMTRLVALHPSADAVEFCWQVRCSADAQ